MIPQLTLLAGLLTLLPAGAQTPAAPAKKPATTGFSHQSSSDSCTDAPRSEWLPEDEMKLLAQHRGYRIKTFKIAYNSCYEVYGFDRNKQIVEAYFNPVTSRLVRQNVAK